MTVAFDQHYRKLDDFPEIYKKEIEEKFNELIELLCKLQYLNKSCGWAWDCEKCQKQIIPRSKRK